MPKRKSVPRKNPAPPSSRPIICCIGASAGGLEAFTRLMEHLSPSTGIAYVIIQHLDPHHPSILPPLLDKKSPIPVLEAEDDMKIRPDHAYVIPSGRLMTISSGKLKLAARSSEKRFMPVDHFMRSLAEEHHGRAIGVILSGTATDGTLGLEAIKAEGGITFAQDDKSAQYGGMPSSAVASGCVDFVLPP